MCDGAIVTCKMSYVSRLEHEQFLETYVLAELEPGSEELGPGYWVRVTTGDGTLSRPYPPPRFAWADPAYEFVQASIVPCNANLLEAVTGRGVFETSADDNLSCGCY